MTTGSGTPGSPFHRGEQEIQERLGVREKLEAFGQQVIRDHMPDQHREFYGMLPFLLIGSVDEDGRPWASIVAGRPGFLTTPDPRTLDIAAPPLFGDPLHTALAPGAEIGILGIQPETRRRNRLTGRVASVRSDGFSVAVAQAFGNCPQYIQTREVVMQPQIDTDGTGRDRLGGRRGPRLLRCGAADPVPSPRTHPCPTKPASSLRVR